MWGTLELCADLTAPTSDNNAPTVIALPESKTHVTIGRRPGSDVILPNPCISATHCVLSKSQLKCTMEYRPRRRDGPATVDTLALHHVVVWEYTLADMSTNGCFVNGTLVGKGRVCTLHNDDTVELVRAAPEKSNKYNLVFRFCAPEELVSPVDVVEVPVSSEQCADTSPPQDGTGKNEEDAPVDSVALLEQHVAADIAVGSDAIQEEEQHIASQQGCPQSAEEAALATREGTTDALRKRHEELVDVYYALDKDTPLGQGSFAAVYAASLRDISANNLFHVIRSLGKALPAYSDDEVLESIAQRLLRHKFAVKIIKKSRFLGPAESQDDPLTLEPQEQRSIIEALLDRSPRAAPLSSQEKRDLFLQLTSGNQKKVERELKNRQRQQREIDILLSVRHPNIIGLFEIFDSVSQLSFVMEQCEGGELFPLVQSFGALPEFFVKLIVFQVLLGVQYLHQIGIAHRDLKLENVLLSRPTSIATLCQLQRDAALLQRLPASTAPGKRDRCGAVVNPGGADSAKDIRDWYHSTVLIPRTWWPEVKISDFGLSRAMDATIKGGSSSWGHSAAMTTMCGTPLYAAPEVTIASLRISASGYTEAVDLFSVGVLCFAMMCGRPPFPNVRDAHGRPQKGRLDYLAPLSWDRKQVTENLPKGDGGEVDLRHVPFVRVSAEGRDFTAKLLRLRPLERMSACEALQHPWLRECHTWLNQ